MRNNFCYIIIVVYNSLKDTISCIDSILNSKSDNYKIILVDNGSSFDSKDGLKSYLKSLRLNHIIELLELNKNYGYAYGVNHGIKYANQLNECEYLWILNNDVRLAKNSLSQLIKSYVDRSIISPAIYDYYDNKKIQSLGGFLNPYFLTTTDKIKSNNIFVDFLSGASLFFNREIININGFFSIKYFMYYEDVEWCIRAKKNNINLVVIDDCKIYHKGNKKLSYKLKTLSQINRLRLCYDHYLYKFPVVLSVVLISLVITPFKRLSFSYYD